MIYNAAKRIAFRTPGGLQAHLKQILYGYRIRNGTFDAGEPEWDRLSSWLEPGMVALDIGANVGMYTLRMSDLVGPTGRVIAFEPIQETFNLLARNVSRARHKNITLVNAAVSDQARLVSMEIPNLAEGSSNFYMAHITDETGTGPTVLSLAIDGLSLQSKIDLIKMDVEGHELAALQGMQGLLARDLPTLIIEGKDPGVAALLNGLGYGSHALSGSPNTIFEANTSAA
jgi:FkbM family methyltransferase